MASDPFNWQPPNPFYREGKWWWYDEAGDECREGFETENGAKEELNDYCFWLDTGMTKYQAQMAHGV